MDLHQRLQLSDAVTKLGKQLIQRRIKVSNLGLMPMIYGYAAADMDRVPAVHQKRRDLCRGDTRIRCHKADTRHQLGCHRRFALGSQHLCVGPEQVFLLVRHSP